MGFYTAKENFVGYDSNGKKYLFVHLICDTVNDLPAYDLYSSNGYIIQMGSTADIITGAKKYQLQSNGMWVDITPNNGVYTLPAASSNSLGGIIVGSGLSIDSNGVLSSTGGASMPYTNHNGGIRGNNLGNSYTAEQKAAIAAGTFDDIYVGDYWDINGIKYYIADIDYYLGYGYPTLTADHHLIVLPDDVLSAQGYPYDNNYYGSSSIYNTYLPAIASDIENKFGNFLINQALVLYQSGGVPFWGQAKCILPCLTQLQGYSQTITPDKMQHKAPQFAFFRYSEMLIKATQRYWLRDSNGYGETAFATPEGSIGFIANSSQYYLRPYFILSGTPQ